MRIINAIHAQSIGGVDQVFRDYSEILVKQGHEVALLISDNGRDNYKISGVKKIFKLKNNAQIFDFLNLFKIIIFYQPKIIFCHSARIMAWARFLKFITKTKFIAVNHGITFKKSLFCNYIISINQEITKMVIDCGFDKNKSFTLKNAIKVDQKFQKKILKNPPIIGIYGRIEPRKGFDILIKAGALLKKQAVDFRLKIGGFEVEGSYNFESLKTLAKAENILENCQFVGTVLDKKNFFEDVDIFCIPSREEPFGIVILEAFLHSTLVISSDTDGGKTLIGKNENGVIFTKENFTELAEKICHILNNFSHYENLPKKAFLNLEKEFSFDCLEKGMFEILQKIK
ncbi:MAG: glycosyltransferase family 4 protein [Rickettsiales bacterium]|nr:glycosyltransferase family 4 protein [Rickettsiales bacterium]